MIERRHLPSTASLSALDALARLGSVTAAAEELSLTQSAVSRQLQALEAQLGAQLFQRRAQRVSLTDAGRRYAEDARRALGLLSAAAMRLEANPAGGVLSLSVLPTFGMRWLVPRLPRFARAVPDVTVNMNSRTGAVDWTGEDVDAAIHYGARPPEGFAAMQLMEERVRALASEAFLNAHPLDELPDVARAPLLHIRSRPKAWEDWFAYQGTPHEALAGTRFDQFSTILQAARHGLGLALVPDYLADEEIAEGRLKPAFGGPAPSQGSYFLIWPEDKADAPALAAFRGWLAEELSAEDMLPR